VKIAVENSDVSYSYDVFAEEPFQTGEVEAFNGAWEEKEAFVVNRLMREKRLGIIEKTGENLYTFKAEVIDPNELTTWLKTFMGRVISVEGGTDEFREKFKDDVNKMYRLYGGEGD